MMSSEPDKLRALCAALPGGRKASIGELARAAGLASHEVAAAVAELRAAGVSVIGDEADGYERELPPPLDARAVQDLVRGDLGRQVSAFNIVSSTMERARELAKVGAGHGAVFLAEGQKAGRGRRGREWHSPARLGLYMSFVLDRRRLPETLTLLPLVAGVAAVNAVREVTALAPRLKWPNDVFLAGAKLGGILAESPAGASPLILGIGVNVYQCRYDFPAGMPYQAVSLVGAGARLPDRNGLAAVIINELDARLCRWGDAGPEEVLAAWRERNVTLGHRVLIPEAELAGTAVNVAADGALIVEDHTGRTHNLYSADFVPLD
ncbi:MAG: biotin--[acetyl-CoA-carboxylase] ligase [Candidatus Zixiibacteriota bacterium]|jgi:BirA family biotin operon repressor/biotin-[acetyl-CoA-carboxylase] ligase